jgi:hypothetical protein
MASNLASLPIGSSIVFAKLCENINAAISATAKPTAPPMSQKPICMFIVCSAAVNL